jgi:hypothetical protein
VLLVLRYWCEFRLLPQFQTIFHEDEPGKVSELCIYIEFREMKTMALTHGTGSARQPIPDSTLEATGTPRLMNIDDAANGSANPVSERSNVFAAVALAAYGP